MHNVHAMPPTYAPTKPNLPNQTYQTTAAKQNKLRQPSLLSHTYQTNSTNPNQSTG